MCSLGITSTFHCAGLSFHIGSGAQALTLGMLELERLSHLLGLSLFSSIRLFS